MCSQRRQERYESSQSNDQEDATTSEGKYLYSSPEYFLYDWWSV